MNCLLRKVVFSKITGIILFILLLPTTKKLAALPITTSLYYSFYITFLSSSTAADSTLDVLGFVLIDCPLSRYTLYELTQLRKKNKDLNFKIVVPTLYYTADEFKHFVEVNKIKDIVINDAYKLYCRAFDINISPSVVLLSTTKKPIYSGAIDDYAITLVLHRLQPSIYYLQLAAMQAKQGQAVSIKKTQPVGCVIE